MSEFERNHESANVSVVVLSDASMDELIAGRAFIQSEIDGRTPTLEEPGAVTVQSGPVNIVENEPEWSEWFEWSGGENPVMGARCEVEYLSEHEEYIHANAVWWDHKDFGDEDSLGNITRYRVLLSSIPKGYSLMHGVLVADMPKGEG